LNIASVWELPVMFVIENNGYGLWHRQTSNTVVKI
jgi:TPP-dependent pyruvate/acetoin dehydrogenase alpha subunit